MSKLDKAIEGGGALSMGLAERFDRAASEADLGVGLVGLVILASE